MTQDIKDFFEALPGRAEGKTAGVNSTYVFDIEGAGTWTVAVTDEGATVTEGDQGGVVHDRGFVGDVLEDRRRRAERHDGVHDGQAEDQGRHGRGHEAPEALLGDAMWAFLLVRLLIAWGVNILALIVVDWMFDSVYIERWGSLLLGAAVLAIGNAFIKPILAILTLPLIIFTLGLAYFAINVAMLALAEWVAPEFSIDGFWTYVGATIVVWFVNFVVGRGLDYLEGGRRRTRLRVS